MAPEPVSLRDVYDIVSKVDDKLNTFINEENAHRLKCATEIHAIDKRVVLIEDRGARFWGVIVGVAGLVAAGFTSLVDWVTD